MTVVEVYPCRQIIAMSFETDLLHRHDCWLCSKAKKHTKQRNCILRLTFLDFLNRDFD